MEFSERLKERRLVLGFTQQQVAEKIGVDTSTYAHYESGRRTPDVKRLKMLCHLFGIAIQDSFPIVRTLEYPPELVESLLSTKQQVEDELNFLETNRDKIPFSKLLSQTHDLINRLETAVEPLQKIWENIMEAPEVDIDDLSVNKTILRINYRLEDWRLISESLQLQSKLINFIFQR